jgi:hypothetical protein
MDEDKLRCRAQQHSQYTAQRNGHRSELSTRTETTPTRTRRTKAEACRVRMKWQKAGTSTRSTVGREKEGKPHQKCTRDRQHRDTPLAGPTEAPSAYHSAKYAVHLEIIAVQVAQRHGVLCQQAMREDAARWKWRDNGSRRRG